MKTFCPPCVVLLCFAAALAFGTSGCYPARKVAHKTGHVAKKAAHGAGYAVHKVGRGVSHVGEEIQEHTR